MRKAAKYIVVGGILVALISITAPIYIPRVREARWRRQAVKALPARPTKLAHPEFAQLLAAAEEQARDGRDWRSALGRLASLYHANGYANEAEALYRILLEADPGNARWPDRLASIYSLYGRLDQSILLWQETIRLAPQYLPAQLNLADALLKTNRASESVAIYSAALKIDPQNPYAIAGLAKADIAAGNWLQAQHRLENAGLYADAKIGENVLVSVYEHVGATDKAAAMRARAKTVDSYAELPDPWVEEVDEDCYDLFRLTLASGNARRRGEFPRALRLLEKAIRLQPSYSLAHFQMGLLQIDLHDLPAAKKAFRTAVDLDSAFGDAWAKLIALSGSRKEAESVLAEALLKCPDSPTLHSLNGNRLKAEGHLDEALEEFKLMARLRPSEVLGLINCAQIYFQRHEDELGVQTLQRALEIVPEDPLVLSTLALYWITAKNESKAQELVLRCQAQPRLPKEFLRDVTNAYSNTFGRAP